MQAKKYYGQNFIDNPRLINQIINLLEPDHNADSLIIEIGPGRGALTSQLANQFKKVIAIEIDSDLVKELRFKNQASNLEIIEADVLDVDWQKLLKKYQIANQKVFLISNLPYYITSPILFDVYKNSHLFDRAVFMMQKEVAERITAKKSTKNYNNLSVISKLFGAIEFSFVVPKNFFKPQPKVDSAIIKIDFYAKKSFSQVEIDEFINFVRNLFNNRRKTILNNLSRLTNDRNLTTNYLKLAKIESSLRPEDLDLDDFINLFKIFKSKNENKSLTSK